MLGKVLIVIVVVTFCIIFFSIDEWVHPTLPGNRGEEEYEAYLRSRGLNQPPDPPTAGV